MKGNVSMMTIKCILVWLQTGCIYHGDKYSRVSVSEKKYIMDHFDIEYNPHKHRYYANEENVFDVLKSEFPKVFEQYDIKDYVKLSYLALHKVN